MGGEVCVEKSKACVTIPEMALDDYLTIFIGPGSDRPPAALSEPFEFGPSGTNFKVPVHIRLLYDEALETTLPSPTLLRIYTKDSTGNWVPLAENQVDRRSFTVTADTTHFSPFVILRSDRLPDGGLPIDIDGGLPPPPPPPPPPFDAGVKDGGVKDAGVVDGGAKDGGTPDSGKPDAGPIDSGTPDAGTPDAGPVDSGVVDSGTPDAGKPDAGPADAGAPDAGAPDAGPGDAGTPDSGAQDAGADAGDGG